MKMFWNDGGRGVESNLAKEASLREALWTWSDEVRGVEGNFLGLIDEAERTIQFYFEAGIPEAVEDAEHLRIVLMDLPRPEEKGAYALRVTVGEVSQLLEKAFQVGADHRRFEGVRFEPW